MDDLPPLKPFFRRDSWGRYEVWPDPRAIAFGRSLRRARLMAGMTQQHLSVKSGVSQSVISRFERGLAPGMSTERLIIISDVLGLRMPLGFCPHDHDCPWPRLMPEAYDHPPVQPRKIGLPVIPKPKHRRGTEIYTRWARARNTDAQREGETDAELINRIAAEVDAERAHSA
jgi:transcriptional regulator with XRE-family HTH domain